MDKWVYIPQFSPWMGGFYERLVRLVKCSMRKSLGKNVLTPSCNYKLSSTPKQTNLVYQNSQHKAMMSIMESYLLEMNCYRNGKLGEKHLQIFGNIWETDYLLS